jgi:hypothetical protein
MKLIQFVLCISCILHGVKDQAETYIKVENFHHNGMSKVEFKKRKRVKVLLSHSEKQRARVQAAILAY